MSKTDKMFDKAAFGYRVEDVDSFIDEQSYKIAALETENKSLTEKMQVLANKINEYREEEADLKNALVGAQKLGTSIVSEAKAKAEAIIAEAEKEAARIIGEAQKKSDDTIHAIKREADREKIRLSKMQREVADFKSRLLSLYKSHLSTITNLPDYEEEPVSTSVPAAPAAPVQQEEPAPAIEETEMPEEAAAAEEQAVAVEQTGSEATLRFDKVEEDTSAFEQKYGDVRFGKNNS